MNGMNSAQFDHAHWCLDGGKRDIERFDLVIRRRLMSESRVEGKMSRVEGNMSRVTSKI